MIKSVLTTVRPQVLGALTRYFHDIDLAEEAFQNGCLRALQAWPRQGLPRDPAAWLILVGRNAGIDETRRHKCAVATPLDDRLPEPGDAQLIAADRLDNSHYRDDVLRLLFVCCHRDLPPTQQIALALRIVCGMSAGQIAHAFLVSERTMQQRITRAKATVASAGLPFEAPSPSERAARLVAISAMVYLIFNEGYSTEAAEATLASPLCHEAIRLARILLGLFPSEPELMGLAALMLLHQARVAARFDSTGALMLLARQDRSLWNQEQVTEGLSLIDKAMRHRAPGPYQIQAAIAALHMQAAAFEQTDWPQIERLYAALERLQPSPVVRLNWAVAIAEVSGPQAALDVIEPLADPLSTYFNYHGVKGGLLLRLGRLGEASAAFNRAISLARTAADAIHIRSQLDSISEQARETLNLSRMGE